MKSDRRKMRLGVFVMTSGHHVAAWRMPESYRGDSFREYAHLARLAEKAKLDMLFVADSLSVRLGNRLAATRGAHNFSPGLLEPLTLLAGLASVTENLGLVATASTQFTPPYNLARQFASLDIISGGRAGWNIVTTADEESARNFGLDHVRDHDARYVRAEEYVDCAKALWDSWTDDAIVRDQAGGNYLDLDKQRFHGFEGKDIKVGGPLNTPRCPQGRPVLVQAGASGPGRDLAARVADVVFTAGATLEEAVAFYKDLKGRAERCGRRPEEVLIMPGITPVVGGTEAEAKAKLDRMNEGIDIDVAVQGLRNFMPELDLQGLPLDGPIPELPLTNAQQSRQVLACQIARRENLTLRQLALRFAGTRGHNTVFGAPEQIADAMEARFKASGADGYNVMPLLFPDSLQDFTEQVVPVLQKRGLFREDYEGPTLRHQLGLTRPALT